MCQPIQPEDAIRCANLPNLKVPTLPEGAIRCVTEGAIKNDTRLNVESLTIDLTQINLIFPRFVLNVTVFCVFQIDMAPFSNNVT